MVLTLTLALVPSLLLVRYFHDRDLYREPPRIIWWTFALGACTVVPVLLVALPMYRIFPMPEDPFLRGTFIAFVFAAIPEEFFKLVVLAGFSLRRRAFDEPMDGIVYGAVVGQGFAALENAMYSLNGGLGITLMRAFTAVPAHATMGVIMGYYVGRARVESARRGTLIVKGFLGATLAHGLYNTPLLTIQAMMNSVGAISPDDEATVLMLMLIALAIFLIMIITAWRLFRSARRDQIELRVPPPMPSPPGLPVPARRKKPAIAYVSILAGIAFSILGGMYTVGGIRVLMNTTSEWQVIAVMFGLLIFFGIIPLCSGIAFFSVGIRKLNSAQTPAISAATP